MTEILIIITLILIFRYAWKHPEQEENSSDDDVIID
ncbi:hypothetical protein MSI_17060 [Treponema sp. JC4]|nr:hypothetical protein MSI_17060 [Treponema sp. JC4]